MKKYIKPAAAGALSFALILTAVTAFAAVQSKTIKSVKNDFKAAEVGIAVQENDDGNKNPTPETKELKWVEETDGSFSAEKKVQILNKEDISTNPAPAFIRVCIIPRFTRTADDGTEIDIADTEGIAETGDIGKLDITGNSYELSGVTFTLSEGWENDWIYGGDGYFYCRSSVEPGDTTPILLEKVSIENALPNGVGLTVDVLADSIQTEGLDSGETNAVSERWGEPKTLGIEAAYGDGGKPVLKEYTEGGDT